METITTQEVELLASLLQRAGVNPYEAIFANSVLDKLRKLAEAAERGKRALEEEYVQASE